MATKANEVDVNLFQVGRLEDSSTVSSQKIAWINYETNKRKLHIQTPAFFTETYGIPRAGPYYLTDRSRAFFKLPFCHARAAQHKDDVDYCAIEKFYNKLVEMDQYFGSEEFKLKLFDKAANKYEYQPIVRHHEQDEEEEVKEEPKVFKSSYRPPYTKIKLMLSNGENENPLFRLFDRKEDGTKTEIPLESFSDATKRVRCMTKHRTIIEVQKIYAMKTSAGSDARKYGVTVKLVAAECTTKEITNNPCIDLFDD
jgi:hypothetical protein